VTTVPFVPLIVALGLLASSVLIHTAMLILLVHWYGASPALESHSAFRSAWLLVRGAWWIVMAHLSEMLLWALAYVWLGALPSIGVALYFSSVTYTTVGYGDVVLPEHWHLLAGVEGLTGILMTGWSTAFLFAVIHHLLTKGDRVRPRAPGGRP
jgi:hypothetical protein